MRFALFIIACLLYLPLLAQESLKVAVAANFYAPLKTISAQFTQKTGINIHLSNGSTGALTVQILNGAPYDIFFAADTARPALLAQKLNIAAPVTYAHGALVAISTKTSPNISTLSLKSLRYLAIANPKISPYGAAAKTVLTHYDLYGDLNAQKKLVVGSNVGKAFRFFQSGNADIALVAASYADAHPNTRIWHVPPALYPPIKQQAIILREQKSAYQFLAFVLSDDVQAQLKSQGYR